MGSEKHLTLEDFLRIHLVPEDREKFSPHLDHCQDCRARFQRLQRELRDQAVQLRRRVDVVPDDFWARQRHQILSRVREAGEPRSPVRRLFDLRVWATAASIFIFSIAVIQWTPRQNAIEVRVDRTVADVDLRDDQLLREVHEAIAEDHAGPLRALDLLVEIPDDAGKGGEGAGG